MRTPAVAGFGLAADGRHVHLFPSASEPLRQGFVRVINHSAEAGEATIIPVDDGGRQFDVLTLSMEANETVHFDSGDLENGNPAKGLAGATGPGQGGWRLEFASDLGIEVLSYVRAADGFLTAMHDVAPADGNVHRVAFFNPGSDRNHVSILRLSNPGAEAAEVTIRGTDDLGNPGVDEVSLSLDAGAAREITAAQLESGLPGLDGALGDGDGKWRLEVTSEQPVVAMGLLESPTGHLANLSTTPPPPLDGVHVVPLFPAAADQSGRHGVVRVVNRSPRAGEVSVRAYDGSDRDYEPLALALGANAAAHFDSHDLEQGAPAKGLSGGTGDRPRRLVAGTDERAGHRGVVLRRHRRRLADVDARRRTACGRRTPGGGVRSRQRSRPGEPAASGQSGPRGGAGDHLGDRRPGLPGRR